MTPTGPMATPQAQAAAAAQAARCAVGDCRYRDPARTRAQCEHDRHAACAGYQAQVYLEPEGPVQRWALCARHRAWWVQEQARIRHRQAREKAQRSGAAAKPREWTDAD